MAVAATDTSAPDWIKADAVADLLGVKPATVRSWRLRGVGPPLYRIGGAVRYERGEVVAWLQTRRTEGGQGADNDME